MLANELSDLLRSIGFSEDQSRIYLSLLERGEGENIERAMTDLGVSPEKAETAIKSLVDKGMLKVLRNQLEVVSPRESLSIVVEQKRREKEQWLEDVERTVADLCRKLEPVYLEKSVGVKSEEILEPLRDMAEMELQTVKVIANAREKIAVFAQTFGWYPKIREELYLALDRRVKARILMTATDENSAKLSKELKELGVEVRLDTPDWYPIRGTLGDSSALVFLIWATRKDGPRPIHYFPHYTTNTGLIRIFSDAFDLHWQQAKSL